MIMPVFLWTDLLIFLLVGAVVLFFWYASHKPHLRSPWKRVIRSRMGMASLVILSAYMLLGLLDSFHYRAALVNEDSTQEVHYSADVLSLLDQVMGPVRTQVEKTYSAPFATHLFTKETLEMPDGSEQRDYPRLKFGGSHLTDPTQDRMTDIGLRIGMALLFSVLASTVLLCLLSLWLARRYAVPFAESLRQVLQGRSELPWNVFLITSTCVLLCLMLTVQLAPVYHVLGTDKVGQDVLYQSVKSIRTGLVIGTLTTLVMLPFAILLGIMAGYFRGWVDDVIQYVYTTLNSIPGVLLIAAAILILQVHMSNHPELFETMAERADIRLLFLCIILGITSWTGLCRLLRGEAFKLRESDYIQAATAFGVSHGNIILRHILPNVMHIVLIAVVLDFSGLVLAEAVLSYVGVGVDPSMISWGNMINRARLEMAREPMVWWSLLAAFLFMFTMVLAANLFSDAVRDAFDPRLRER